jgi:hypothetical protein
MKNFKSFYLYRMPEYQCEFPNMPSYERFLTLQSRVVPIMMAMFMCFTKNDSNTAFVDSTPIRVCNNKRIFNHKVFRGVAERGKSTMGWFFGFKLHLLIDTEGNVINAQLTPGNCDDRKPVEDLIFNFQGDMFGDKGYVSKDLFSRLYERGVKLITGLKKGMENMLMPLRDKILLKKRSLIETVFGYMKNIMMLEHSRHRSKKNFLTHIAGTLISYQLMPHKPSITPIFKEITTG